MRLTNLLSFTLILFLLHACSNSVEKIPYNSAFNAYLAGFTNGEISSHSNMVIHFSAPLDSAKRASITASDFSTDPSIEGEVVWTNDQTVEFIPKSPLKSGEVYNVSFKMSSLFDDLDEELAVFRFQCKTKDQYIRLQHQSNTIQYIDGKKHVVSACKMTINDIADVDDLKNTIKSVFDGSEHPLTWEKRSGKIFTISTPPLPMSDSDKELKFTWNGREIGAESGSLSINIPSKNSFFITNVSSLYDPEQTIIVEFSDLLDPNQRLEGLINLENVTYQAGIENNRLKIFIDGKYNGMKSLQIDKEIKSESNKSLAEQYQTDIMLSDAKPSVMWVDKGNILPNADGMPLLFKSINLSAIDIRVIKVSSNSVLQFFQVNNFDSDNELKRVGKVVASKRIDFDLSQGLELSDWTVHSIDLSSIFEAEPGAIYEVAIGFRKSYSLFNCDTENITQKDIEMLELPKKWDEPGYQYSYWDYYESDYQYGDREDPCSRYYYNPSRALKKNILASNIGLTAKNGDNGLMVFATDLKSAEPLAGVSIDIYDYHQDKLVSIQTDGDGMASAQLTKKPFFMIASNGEQRGYLRMDDGNALSMSRFDVGGSNYENGLKGFIYAERGVWRPGDNIYLNFILQDNENHLPDDHPVVMTLTDSRGQLVVRKQQNQHIGNIYDFQCKTNSNAPTGNYTARVDIGAASFTKVIRIETIKPNRMKMALDFGSDFLKKQSQAHKIKLSASWLHGAPASEAKAKIRYSLSSKQLTFDKHPGFHFNDNGRSMSSQTKTVFEGKLDKKGQVTFEQKFDTDQPVPGLLEVNYGLQVFEPSGDFSISTEQIDYHPYDRYVGLRLPKGDAARNMLLTDQDHVVEFIAVDSDGNRVDMNYADVRVYKLSWKWWFDNDKDQVPNYRGRINGSLIKSDVVYFKDGKAKWNLRVNYPDWGRYYVLIKDGKTGHSAGKVVYIDWPGWAGRSSDSDPEGAAALHFNADKPTYNVGDDIELNIPCSFDGRVLLTIESHSKVLSATWLKAKEGQIKHQFKATADMAPNAYACVTLIQPHGQTTNDLPMRMYGAIPLFVEDPQTHLKPSIEIASTIRPGEQFDLTVGEQGGGPMAYTISIVDEGLLGLTNYKTPSPWSTFFQRMSLGVKTWDLYNYVLGAFGGEVNSLLSIGGGGSNKKKDSKKNKDRFKPVVIHAGPFQLKKGSKNEHSFKMPDYFGEVRVMVVATQDNAYGSSEQAVKVKKPIMMMASLPRKLGPNESFKLPITLFVTDKSLKNGTLQIKANEMFTDRGKSLDIDFTGQSEQMIYVDMKTQNRVGKGYLELSIQSGNETATQKIYIDVLHANQKEYASQEIEIAANGKKSLSADPIGIQGTNTATLEISSLPPIGLEKRLDYLIRYPYGCIEQTTSSVFPQLYVHHMTDLSPSQKVQISQNIKLGIDRLTGFQVNGGGFSYWPGNTKADQWGTNYAGHFLIEAQKNGYDVPASIISNWKKYQIKMARKWTNSSYASADYLQGYRLYLLALSGSPQIGAMNKMRLKKGGANQNMGYWFLAAAYQIAGQKNVATDIVRKLNAQQSDVSDMTKMVTYGSPFRDKCIQLMAVASMDISTNRPKLMKEIAKTLSSNKWLSTQETAFALLSLAEFYTDRSSVYAFEYKIGDDSWQKATTNKAIYQLKIPVDKSVDVEIKNSNADQLLFATLTRSGIPQQGKESDIADGLRLTTEYTSINGNTIDLTDIAQNEEMLVTVTLKNISTENLSELAIRQVFPSGWEILNTRLMKQTLKNDKADYVDYRDDRVHTFLDLRPGESRTYTYMLNAAFEGRYYLPGIRAEAMYDRSVQAQQKGRWITIVKDVES